MSAPLEEIRGRFVDPLARIATALEALVEQGRPMSEAKGAVREALEAESRRQVLSKAEADLRRVVQAGEGLYSAVVEERPGIASKGIPAYPRARAVYAALAAWREAVGPGPRAAHACSPEPRKGPSGPTGGEA